MEINGDVTDAGRTNDDERQTREDRATQPMDAGWLSLANCLSDTLHKCETNCCQVSNIDDDNFLDTDQIGFCPIAGALVLLSPSFLLTCFPGIWSTAPLIP